MEISRPAGRISVPGLKSRPTAKFRPTGAWTRFAPAPTGYLHLGHVLNAIYVWGVAGPIGARVMLRIEDHDQQRSRPEYEAALHEDLAWLGFEPDAVSRQSDREATYAAALARLDAQGLTYRCACTRKEIGQHTATGQEPRYAGTCRDLDLPDGPGRGVRIRLGSEPETFDDLMLGLQSQTPAEQCGDLLARDRHGLWTYQFAAVADDHAQGITHVIRGDDLLPSTGRQIALARLLGRPEPPRFLHHPLILKSPNQKLSKSDTDSGVRDLRAAGWSPTRVIGLAASVAGLIVEPRDLGIGALPDLLARG